MREPKRFKKKPVVIEAIQYTGKNLADVQAFVGVIPDHDGNTLGFRTTRAKAFNSQGIKAVVWDKLHGTWVGVADMQWVIKGVKGEFYPCDPEVLEETYDEEGHNA